MDKFKKAMLDYIERNKEEILERHCEMIVGYPTLGINILGDKIYNNNGFDFGPYDYSDGGCGLRYLDIDKTYAQYDQNTKTLTIDFKKSKEDIKRLVNAYIDAAYDAYQKQFKELECGKS